MTIKDTRLDEENFEYLTKLIIKNVQTGLAYSVLKAEIKEIKEFLNNSPACYLDCGAYRVNWIYCEELNGWELSSEEKDAYKKAFDECVDCEGKIYTLNRLEYMLMRL